MIESKSGLTAADLATLAASGIPAALAEQAQLRRVDSQEGGAIIGRKGCGDYAGVVFPYMWPGESGAREYRLRRDRPELEYKDGKPRERAKYLGAPGRGSLLYLVPGTSPEWLSDPSLPIVITEGEKKTLALWVCAWDGLGDAAEKPAFLPVGLPGVWNWRGTTGRAPGPTGDRRPVKGVIPDFQRIGWKGRRGTILFDTNTTDNESVQAARRELSNELRKLGAEVFWFSWPGDTPAELNGIDDLVGLWGAPKVRALITERARPCRIASEHKSSAREFQRLDDDRYRLTVPAIGTSLEIDRVHWEHNDLLGMLSVRCELPGAKTVQGNTISVAEFNISGPRGRLDRAKFLGVRPRNNGQVTRGNRESNPVDSVPTSRTAVK